MEPEKEILVAIVFPGVQRPAFAKIENELAPMQGIVGGYIETSLIRRGEARLVAVCNEEGVPKRLPRNSLGFWGTFFITAEGEDGEFRSLTDGEQDLVVRILKEGGDRENG